MKASFFSKAIIAEDEETEDETLLAEAEEKKRSGMLQ